MALKDRSRINMKISALDLNLMKTLKTITIMWKTAKGRH
jgi:hypothetical protein